MKSAVLDAQEALRKTFEKATDATKQNTFKEVLWACSIIEPNEHGTFRASDVVGSLAKILQRPDYTVNHFSYPLGKFCSEDKGNILTRSGAKNRRRYKFTDPLMRSFLLLDFYNNARPSNDEVYQQLSLFVFCDE